MRFSENAVAELLVRVEQLSVTYLPDSDQPIRALDSVSLEIRPGERIGILGESGSGKSTWPPPYCGCCRVMRVTTAGRSAFGIKMSHAFGVCIAPDSRRGDRSHPARAGIGFKPCHSRRRSDFEVLRAHLPMSRRDRKARVEELLAEVGFDQPQSIYAAYPHQLSGGQRQRIVIAQAIACNPQLVIADEATSKLDASLQAEIMI